MKNYVVATGLLASSCLVAMQAYGGDDGAAVSDAWIDGQLEAVYALDRHLSAFEIDTSVAHGVVRLTGVVGSDTDRNLAGELAKGIEGVVEVRNILLLAVQSDDAAAAAAADVEDARGPPVVEKVP